MTNMLSSPWIPALFLLLLAGAARLLSKNWLAPSAFILGVWSLYLVLPLALAPEYKVSGLTVWIIVLLAACMSLGAVLGEGRSTSMPTQAVKPELAERLSRWGQVFAGLALVGAVYSAIAGLREYGFDLSLAGLLLLGHAFSVARYAGEQPPALVRALVTWVFAAALLGGMSYSLAKTRRSRLLCFTPLLAAALFSFVQGAKANTLIAIALALGGYLAMQTVITGGLRRPISGKALLSIAISLLSVLSFFMVVQTLRSHNDDADLQLETNWARLKSASIGYLGVLTDWANGPEHLTALRMTMGAYTFAGVFDAIGLHARQTGLYEESIVLDGENDSNIYTVFRGVIEDFTLPGATLFLFLMGLLVGSAHRRCCRGSMTSVPVVAAFYAFLFWSPIVSIFNYNGPILAILVGIFVLRGSSGGSSSVKSLSPALGGL